MPVFRYPFFYNNYYGNYYNRPYPNHLNYSNSSTDDRNRQNSFHNNIKYNLSKNSNEFEKNNLNKINLDNKKNNSNKTDNSSNYFFELFGLKLYFDDILLICLIFFLYQEGVKDDELFISLILLLLS